MNPEIGLKKLSWYHGALSRHLAEVLLMSNGIEGSFLLRKSTTDAKEYAVSVRAKDQVRHFKVALDGRIFHFGVTVFESVDDLASYFANQPMLGTKKTNAGQNRAQGTLVTLKHPYPAHVPEPEAYDEIRMQSTLSVDASVKTMLQRQKAVALATKAGYLTKEGESVKSWKRRWFVLIRYQLTYFDDKDSEKPINTVDLTNMKRCMRSEQTGKRHCFSIECKDRTWNLSADSDDEAFEWITLLKWKLNNLDRESP